MDPSLIRSFRATHLGRQIGIPRLEPTDSGLVSHEKFLRAQQQTEQPSFFRWPPVERPAPSSSGASATKGQNENADLGAAWSEQENSLLGEYVIEGLENIDLYDHDDMAIIERTYGNQNMHVWLQEASQANEDEAGSTPLDDTFDDCDTSSTTAIPAGRLSPNNPPTVKSEETVNAELPVRRNQNHNCLRRRVHNRCQDKTLPSSSEADPAALNVYQGQVSPTLAALWHQHRAQNPTTGANNGDDMGQTRWTAFYPPHISAQAQFNHLTGRDLMMANPRRMPLYVPHVLISEGLPMTTPTCVNFTPSADIYDVAGCVLIYLLIPGGKKSDMMVKFHPVKPIIYVNGVVYLQPNMGRFVDRTILLREMTQEIGLFSREFYLGAPWITDRFSFAAATVTFADGIMTIVLPKRAPHEAYEPTHFLQWYRQRYLTENHEEGEAVQANSEDGEADSYLATGSWADVGLKEDQDGYIILPVQ